MTNEELCALAQSGSIEARDALTENNLAFVRRSANRFFYQNSGLCGAFAVDADDLFQEGCIGMMKAIGLFKPEKDNLFLTYASKTIQSAMWDLLREHSDLFEQRIQDKGGLAITRVGLYDMVGTEERSERIQLIADPNGKTPEQIYIENESHEELRHALDIIGDRERDYLRYRFGFDGEDAMRPLIQTATHFHLSESRAKRTEEVALDNLWLELPWWY